MCPEWFRVEDRSLCFTTFFDDFWAVGRLCTAVKFCVFWAGGRPEILMGFQEISILATSIPKLGFCKLGGALRSGKHQQRGIRRGALGRRDCRSELSPTDPTLLVAFLASRASLSVQNLDCGIEKSEFSNSVVEGLGTDTDSTLHHEMAIADIAAFAYTFNILKPSLLAWLLPQAAIAIGQQGYTMMSGVDQQSLKGSWILIRDIDN